MRDWFTTVDTVNRQQTSDPIGDAPRAIAWFLRFESETADDGQTS